MQLQVNMFLGFPLLKESNAITGTYMCSYSKDSHIYMNWSDAITGTYMYTYSKDSHAHLHGVVRCNYRYLHVCV